MTHDRPVIRIKAWRVPNEDRPSLQVFCDRFNRQLTGPPARALALLCMRWPQWDEHTYDPFEE